MKEQGSWYVSIVWNYGLFHIISLSGPLTVLFIREIFEMLKILNKLTSLIYGKRKYLEAVHKWCVVPRWSMTKLFQTYKRKNMHPINVSINIYLPRFTKMLQYPFTTNINRGTWCEEQFNPPFKIKQIYALAIFNYILLHCLHVVRVFDWSTEVHTNNFGVDFISVYVRTHYMYINVM